MLNVIDEFTHECLAIRIDRKLKAVDVIDVLSDLLILRGVPGHIRSDNGPEFVAKAVQEWIAAVGARTAYIAPGSPWENGYMRELQRQASRRTAQRRDLLHVEGGPDRDRELAAPLQRRAPPLHRWATSRRHPKCSCLPLRRGRLRALKPLRRPRSPWCRDRR